MAAAQYGLDNLCLVIDRNRLQISGTTEQVMAHENMAERLSSFGWHTVTCRGNDYESLAAAFDEARGTRGRPTAILAQTVKGCGISFMEDQVGWHHRVPTEDEYQQAMQELEVKAQVICEELMRLAAQDRDVLVLCSDSRGSGSMTDFAKAFPRQFVEVGIAEQDLVGIAAGLAKCGKKPYVVAPGSFLACRSLEQIKVDVAYSGANVKLIGISSGISYGPLGMSHHSAQDVACVASLPGIEVYVPSDAAYIKVGRSAVEDIYTPQDELSGMTPHGAPPTGVLLVACGEVTQGAVQALRRLREAGYSAALLDAVSLKPFDQDTLLRYAAAAHVVVTVEEHAAWGGLYAAVSSVS